MQNVTKLVLIFVCTLFLSPLTANNIKVENIIYDDSLNTLSFDLSWDNGFNLPAPGPVNYSDFAYLFIKFKNSNGTNWEHMPVPIGGHLTDNPPPYLNSTGTSLPNGEYSGLIASYFYLGFSEFVSGSISVRCTVALSEYVTLLNPSFKVFAIEMINSTKHFSLGYFLGDGTSQNRFYKGDEPNEPFYYTGSGNVDVGTGSEEINVSGNPLPVAVLPGNYFGSKSYPMKYEITQEQYVDFLNCLNTRFCNDQLIMAPITMCSPRRWRAYHDPYRAAYRCLGRARFDRTHPAV